MEQHIVNMDHIVTITGNDLHLFDKQILPLSSVYKKALLNSVVNNNVLTRFA